MKSLSFDSILLFTLVIPFIMTYRLSPGTTPYWLFGLIFFGLLIYAVLDYLKLSIKTYFNLKQLVLWLLIVGVIGGAFFSVIIVRHQTAPIYGVHDITIQLESAIRFLIHGKNPYAVTYFGTPLEQWHYSDTEVNPALYHFVMQPFYLLFSIPFYLINSRLFGFFDGRFPLYFLFFLILILISKLVKDKSKRLQFLVLMAFNPAMLSYTLEGRSDVFMFAFLFISFYLLYLKKYSFAGILMALSFTIKQSVWPIFPFYITYLYFKTNNIKQTAKLLVPFFVTTLLVIGPFMLWNNRAFLDSTVFYLSGGTLNSYPISGYGFGMLLNELGFIKDLHQQYPFYIWQLIFCLPALIILIIFLKRKPTINRFIFAYGVFLFIFWYFSRYFNNSHAAYLSMVFITAYFWPEEGKQLKENEK